MDSAGFYVQVVAGAVRTWVEWDWERGEASFRRALEINPEAAEVRAHYASLLMMLSRWEECEEEMDRALELDPRNPIVLAFYGQTLNGRAMFPEAIAFFQNALRTAPDNPVAHSGLMTAYRGEGMHQKALEHAAASLAAFTGEDLAPSLQATYRSEGHEAAWRMAAEAFLDVSKETYVLPWTVAVLFDWAGETDQAFEWLERAFEVRDPNLPYLNVLFLSDTLRADPRFRDLQRRMNLPAS
jgi:tetratricopeptide (TPR) repeat protein